MRCFFVTWDGYFHSQDSQWYFTSPHVLFMYSSFVHILGEFGSFEEEYTRFYEHELLGCAGLLSSCAICQFL